METDIALARQAAIKADIRAVLRDIPIHHFTIEFEAPGENCSQQHS
jgi:acid stress-induced BolA-like protein IbaG/YrbA